MSYTLEDAKGGVVLPVGPSDGRDDLVTELAVAVCSITMTKRRRFFWAAWWTARPVAKPFGKPDASNGGAASREEAHAEAEKVAGRSLVVIDARWARAWSRILRGQTPWTAHDAKATHEDQRDPPPTRAASPTSIPASMWTILGISSDATEREIKAAFRKRALETHPDHGGEPAQFAAVKRAYERALAKAETRARARGRRRGATRGPKPGRRQ